jgi:hypothetical protein
MLFHSKVVCRQKTFQVLCHVLTSTFFSVSPWFKDGVHVPASPILRHSTDHDSCVILSEHGSGLDGGSDLVN